MGNDEKNKKSDGTAQINAGMAQEAAKICECIRFSGDTLYHYTSTDALVGILEKRQFFISDYSCMNDRAESTYPQKLFSELLGSETPEIRNELEAIAEQAQKKAFVLSFSTESDELSMWTFYTGKGGFGYRLEMDVQKFMDILKPAGKPWAIWDYVKAKDATRPELPKILNENLYYLKMLGEVIYDKAEQVKPLRGTIAFYKKHRETSKFAAEQITTGILSRVFPFIKYEKFYNEHEVRLVLTIDNLETIGGLLNFRSSNNMIVPYLILELKQWMPDFFKNVMIGPPGNRYDDIETGLHKFLVVQGYHKMEIQRSSIELRHICY